MKRAVLLVPALVTAAGIAQDERPAVEKPPPSPAAVAAAIDAALQLPQRDERVEAAVKVVLAAGLPTLQELGGRLRAAAAADAEAQADANRGSFYALRTLVQKVAIGFVERAVNSEMFFAGQYDDLRVLQPHVGSFFFDLVIDPPPWFHDDKRPWIVRALRDLHPDAIDEGLLQALRQIAEDREFETEALREALTYALAQWGDRELIERRLQRVREQLGSGDAEDRCAALQREANIHYMVRDYARAATLHRHYLRSAEKEGLRLTPEDYYNAACCLSLSADIDGAFAELERCVALMRSGHVDASLMLERKLFETDRDVAALRDSDRFRALVERAFGKQQPSPKK